MEILAADDCDPGNRKIVWIAGWLGCMGNLVFNRLPYKEVQSMRVAVQPTKFIRIQKHVQLWLLILLTLFAYTSTTFAINFNPTSVK